MSRFSLISGSTTQVVNGSDSRTMLNVPLGVTKRNRVVGFFRPGIGSNARASCRGDPPALQEARLRLFRVVILAAIRVGAMGVVYVIGSQPHVSKNSASEIPPMQSSRNAA